jgi:L-alanine-DL-glutamate epimerase-like enolase superfamily enzyme
LPIFADESVHRAADLPRLAGAFDGINIKLMKCGGLGEALRMIAVARALGLKVMLGCMVETSLAITAAAQIRPSWTDRPGRRAAGVERSFVAPRFAASASRCRRARPQSLAAVGE